MDMLPLSEKINIAEKPSDIIFADFPDRPGSAHVYKELKLGSKLALMLGDILEDYNLANLRGMQLVLFDDAILHLARIARIIRMPRGNVLIVGLGGSGRQSLIRLAAHIGGCRFETVEVTKSYGQQEFREDLKKPLRVAGEKKQQCVLYISDNHIIKESFFEDLNNLLNVGDIPNIWQSYEIDELVESVRPLAKEAGKPLGRDDVKAHFTSLVRSNLHVVLCMSPSGKQFRNRLRQFPSLVNCCTMDWFGPWPQHALLQVARRRTVTWAVDQRYTDKMAEACVHMHLSVEQASARFQSEMKRHNYTTPASYLELLNSYEGILKEMDQSIAARHSKLSNGLQTLIRTNSEVEEMQGQLIAIQPRLEQSQKDTLAIMKELSAQQQEVEAKQEIVRAEEAEVSKSADEAEELVLEAQNNLDNALPKYNVAIKADQSPDKSDISEVKSFARPPELVMFVLQAVSLLFNQPQTWEQAKKLMNAEFLGKLHDYDKDSLDEKMKSKPKANFINNPKFQPEVVESVSKAAKSLCQWVRALFDYSEVYQQHIKNISIQRNLNQINEYYQ
ncbi:MAG: putative dynein heavy chain [Streblomastix strix]|nr:MAG: putative dynein heavy chain [Streblomastix strix]